MRLESSLDLELSNAIKNKFMLGFNCAIDYDDVRPLRTQETVELLCVMLYVRG
jgi:hypothetical protein